VHCTISPGAAVEPALAQARVDDHGLAVDDGGRAREYRDGVVPAIAPAAANEIERVSGRAAGRRRCVAPFVVPDRNREPGPLDEVARDPVAPIRTAPRPEVGLRLRQVIL
jgi:hypothetical protein